MKKVWHQSGNAFILTEESQEQAQLPVGIYKVAQSLQGLFLEQIQEKFLFPYKVYGMESKFIQRVLKTYEHTTGNMGVLLNGVKGTGKTVTMELIANKLEMPVLIVSADFDGLPSFLNDIQQDIVVIFDEFEKVFPEDYKNGSKLLTIMDGALKTAYRKVFLLSTNDLHIDTNFIQRPGRIRYVKTFRNLEIDTIIEIVDDKLVHKHLREDAILFISQLELITVDIVSSVIQEFNIHNEESTEFEDIFNIKKLPDEFNIVRVTPSIQGPAIEKVVRNRVRINPFRFDDESIGTTLYINRNQEFGLIKGVDDNGYTLQIEPITEEIDEDGDYIYGPVETFRIDPQYPINKAFKQYSW